MVHIRTCSGNRLQRDCGTLLEIWPSGGVIHTDQPMADGQKFTISVEGYQVEAEVQSSQQDEYGFYLAFKVGAPWFPESYQPPYLSSKPTVVEAINSSVF